MDAEAVSFDIVEAQVWRVKMEEEVKRREAEAKPAQLKHSIAWLAVDDALQESDLERRSDRHHRGTCEWVAKVPQMTSWNTDDFKEPVLWLKGIPGAGKPYNLRTLICPHYFRQERNVLLYLEQSSRSSWYYDLLVLL